MPRNLVFIAVDFMPNTGGIARYLYGIINHLPAHRVTAIALPSPGWQAFDSAQHFPIRRLRLSQKWHPYHKIIKFLGPLFFQYLLKMPDVGMVICCQSDHALMLAAWLLKIVRGTPYCVFLHGNDVLLALQRWYKGYYLFLLRSSQVIVANSYATANLAQSLGIEQRYIKVLHPCIDLDNLTNSTHQMERILPKQLDDKRTFLTVGRLVERKGHDVALRALPLIRQEVIDAHYVIVGSGQEESRLKELAANLNVLDAVTFVGHIPDADLSAFYNNCAVFVMVSREIPEKGDVEGFGIVYLEANLYGKPVVAGKSGGVADAVIEGETGLLVNPTDETAVAHAIIRLLKEPALATKLGQQGRERVLREFGCDTTAKKFLAIIDSCIEQ